MPTAPAKDHSLDATLDYANNLSNEAAKLSAQFLALSREIDCADPVAQPDHNAVDHMIDLAAQIWRVVGHNSDQFDPHNPHLTVAAEKALDQVTNAANRPADHAEAVNYATRQTATGISALNQLISYMFTQAAKFPV